MSIYEQLIKAGCEISNHCSDLYVPADEVSTPIVNAWEFKNQIERFQSIIDKRPMYCLPFAYDPYWTNKARDEQLFSQRRNMIPR